MSAPHQVIGEGVVILHTAASATEARAWVRGYTLTGFGGWAFIELRDQDGRLIDTFHDHEHA